MRNGTKWDGNPARSLVSLTVLTFMVMASFWSVLWTPGAGHAVGLGPGTPSSRQGMVQWVQDSPDDFNGSGSNLAQFTGMVVDAKGVSLDQTISYWNQTDWSGGPNVAATASDGNVFWSSTGIMYTAKGELALQMSPVWGQKASLIQGRGALKAVWDPTHKQAIVFGGFAWIGSTRTLLNNTEYYNPSTNKWTTGANTPPGRQTPSVAWDSKRGKMWVFGGNDGSVGQFNDGWYLSPGAGSGGTWSKLATCVEPMQNGNGVYDPNLDILVAHGRSYYQVTRYDPVANTYSEGSDVYHIRDGAGGAWLPDEKLFMIVNGVDYANKPETGFYAPGNNTWIDGPNMPAYREYPTLVWDDLHKLAILYGGTTTGGTDGVVNEIWLFDPATDSWTHLQDSSGPKVYTHGAVWDPDNHQMLVIGGIDSVSENGKVYSMKLLRSATGSVESSTLDTQGISEIKKVSWEILDAPTGVGPQPVKVQIASSASGTPTVFVGPDGTSGTYFTTSGSGETGLPHHQGDRYLRYKITLSTANQDYTPKVGNISIEYSSYASTGSMVSSVFDTGSSSMTGLEAFWDADIPTGSQMDVYVRTSPNSDMSSATSWFKVDDGVPFTSGVIEQYLQYKVEMRSPTRGTTPVLRKMTITMNRAPTLDQGGHSPQSGGAATLFTFSVIYTDPESAIPSQSAVFIDNVMYNMSSTGNGSIPTGMRYEYKTKLALGAHSYYFQFNDSYGAIRYPAKDLLNVIVKDAPILTMGDVTPKTGDLTTLFKFLVRYSDKGGLSAFDSKLIIDDTKTYNMVTQDNGNAGYYLYTYETKLQAGTHHYSFDFSNGVNHVYLPETGAFSGPVVTVPEEPLQVVQIIPRDAETGIPITASISVTFNKPIIESTIDRTTFILKDSNGTAVFGTYLYKPSTYEAVLTPATSLQYDTLYSVKIDQDIMDTNGTCMLGPFASTFRTVKKEVPHPNRPPVVQPVMNLDGTAGKTVSLKLNASDPDGDRLAYKIISGPNGPTVNENGLFTWATKTKDAGNNSFVIEVSDGEYKQYIMLTVNLKKGSSGHGNQGMNMIALAAGIIIALVVSMLVVLMVLRSKKKDEPAPPPSQAPPEAPPPPPAYPAQAAHPQFYGGVPVPREEVVGPRPGEKGQVAPPQEVRQEAFYSEWEKPTRPGLEKEYAFKAPTSMALTPKVMTKAQMDETKASTQRSSDSRKVMIDGTAYTRVDILRIISSLPRGLPSELWGKDLDDLADEIINGEYSTTPEGNPIVKLGRKWFNGDPQDKGTYMRPYKGSRSD